MNGNDSMSPADVAALTKNTDGNSSLWCFLIIILFFALGGNWGNRQPMPQQQNSVLDSTLAAAGAQGGFVTQSDLTNALDMQSVQQGQRDITAATKDSEQRLTAQVSDLKAQVAALAQKQDTCCAEMTMQVQQAKQAILDDARDRENRNLRDENMQLKFNSAIGQSQAATDQQFNQVNSRLNLIPTVPVNPTFNAGPYPFCGCGCAQG